jgi:hypothetical protein
MAVIYLYIKTHNKTGLKYLGKTIRDPYKYKGSGKRWTEHIKKHGYDVTTEILGIFDTNEDLAKFSIPLSEKLKIVESNDWANLKIESGDGGDTSKYIDYSQLNRGKGQTYEQRYGVEKASALRSMRAKKLSETRKGKTYEQIHGKDRATLLRQKRSQDRTVYNTGKIHSTETRKKISEAALGRKQLRCSCVICQTEISINNITSHYKIHQS